jgi:phosphoribosylanthranilate isomerase
LNELKENRYVVMVVGCWVWLFPDHCSLRRIMTIVKICGIKTVSAAQTAIANGADFLGLVFYPPSPRFVGLTSYTPQGGTGELRVTIGKLIKESQRNVKVGGLFVNESLAGLASKAEEYDLDFLQLHGDETPEFCHEAGKIRPVIKALRLPPDVELTTALNEAEKYAKLDNLTFLLDTQTKGFYGGTGLKGNWAVAQELAKCYNLLLAGGLSPDNVREAVALVKPYGVDVSSGVEYTDKPGEKDLAKIHRFIAEAKNK